MKSWNPDSLIKIWSEDIESVVVDGWSRKVSSTKNEIIGIKCPEYHITFELDDLSKGDKTIDDYSNKLYSKWGFEIINIFIEKFRLFSCLFFASCLF